MSAQPGPLPTIDVAEAERRLRDDPSKPILLDVREPHIDSGKERRDVDAGVVPRVAFGRLGQQST